MAVQVYLNSILQVITSFYFLAYPVDYVKADVLLYFSVCQTKSCINVEIIDDEISEKEEKFTFTLTTTPGHDPRIIFDPVITGEVTIIDDDNNEGSPLR